jgi:hypothetical protein
MITDTFNKKLLDRGYEFTYRTNVRCIIMEIEGKKLVCNENQFVCNETREKDSNVMEIHVWSLCHSVDVHYCVLDLGLNSVKLWVTYLFFCDIKSGATGYGIC